VPSGLVARHIRPCITPAIHIEAMYSTMPMVAIQKWAVISLVLHLGLAEHARDQVVQEPMETIATQPSAPECTWPTVQSV
jgi:hypothetical protein